MTTWGGWSYGSPSNGVRLGADWYYVGDQLCVSISTQSQYTFSQTYGHAVHLYYSGSWSGGPADSAFVSSAGQVKTIWTGQWTQAYNTSITLNFSMTGFYNGAAPSISFSSYLVAPPPSTGQVSLSSTSFTMGDTITAYTNRPDPSERIKLSWLFGSASGYIVGSATAWSQVDAASAAWTPTVAMLAAQIPNATSGIGSVYCDYFAGSGVYLGTTTVGFTVALPTSVVPTLTMGTPAESGTGGVGLTGKYVQNYSAATFAITAATPQGGAGSISSGLITVNGVEHPVSGVGSTTLSPITFSGTGIATTGSVTDSRGRTSATASAATIDVLPYTSPTLTSFSFYRCGSSGVADALGTYIRVTSAGSATTLASTIYSPAQRNSLIWKIETQPVTGGSWTVQKTTTIPQGTSSLSWSSVDTVGGGGLSVAASYNVRLTATDAFNGPSSVLLLPSGVVTMSWSDTGVGIGKIQTPGRALDVVGLIYQNDGPVLPPGVSWEYAGSTAPAGWLMQDGTAVSRTTYAALFAVISTVFGAGDGSTTFNVPDRRGRVGIGVGTATGAAGATAHTLAQLGGEETHALTSGENGPHTHGLEMRSGGTVDAGNTDDRAAREYAGSIESMSFFTLSSGSGTAHNTMQPYIGMNYIIKY